MTTIKLWNSLIASVLIMLSVTLVSCGGNPKVSIGNMRCEHAIAPIGIDAPAPRFTWNYLTDKNNSDFAQVSYRLSIAQTRSVLEKVASTEELCDGKAKFSWSSPVIASSNSYAEYSGDVPLSSGARYYWRVIAVDANGGGTLISPIDSFETAKINPDEWSALWITDNHDKSYDPAPMLRHSFDVKSDVLQARLYVSAVAYYKMSLNGDPVTQNRLDPGYTHYDKRNLYAKHDVTGLLNSGENVLAAVLGNGFYNADAPVATWDFEKARWRNRQRMICELHIDYADGTTQVVNSDSSWKVSTGPYLRNNIYSGDTYDARLEIANWDKAGFDDSQWLNAQAVDAPSPMMISQKMPAIKAMRQIPAVSVRSFGDTTYVYDFGINLTGLCRLQIEGERGTKVTLMYGELLKDNGLLEMRNLDIYYKPLPGLAFQTDTYVLKGEGIENFTPDFTYHGFQYVEVKSDRPIKLKNESLTAEFMHTAVEQVGNFSCSNELLNKIWSATNQSYLSNLTSIPTDCPQREKNGWIADGHIAMDLALLNYDGILFYEKWLDDFVDNQNAEGRISGIIPSSGWGYDDWIGPVWDAAMFIIPRALYDYYGDTKSIEKMYPVCEKYLEYLQSREEADGCVTYGIGDWVPYKTTTPTDYTSTCYYYLDNKLMAQFATILGHDGSRYTNKADQLYKTINSKHYNAETGLYANGSQAAQGIALYLGLVPQDQAQRVADNLNELVKATNYHLDFGVLGSKTVLRALSDYGYADAAYRMAAQEDEPSWGGWINRGFTTLAETWVISAEFRDASINHVFLGDVSAWMYSYLAGINFDPQQPGFRNILIRPHFVEGLDWAKASYRSQNGMVSSEWRRRGEKVVLKVTIPVNTTATVTVGGKLINIKSGTHELKF